jgi:hypothetical protein
VTNASRQGLIFEKTSGVDVRGQTTELASSYVAGGKRWS